MVLVLIVLLVYRANKASHPMLHGKIFLSKSKLMSIRIILRLKKIQEKIWLNYLAYTHTPVMRHNVERLHKERLLNNKAETSPNVLLQHFYLSTLDTILCQNLNSSKCMPDFCTDCNIIIIWLLQ